MMDFILKKMSNWPSLGGPWEFHPHKNVLSGASLFTVLKLHHPIAVLQGNLIGRAGMGPYFTSSLVQNMLHPDQPQTMLFEGVAVQSDNAGHPIEVDPAVSLSRIISLNFENWISDHHLRVPDNRKTFVISPRKSSNQTTAST